MTGPLSAAAAATGTAIENESTAPDWDADAMAGTAIATSPARPAAAANLVNLCA